MPLPLPSNNRHCAHTLLSHFYTAHDFCPSTPVSVRTRQKLAGEFRAVLHSVEDCVRDEEFWKGRGKCERGVFEWSLGSIDVFSFKSFRRRRRRRRCRRSYAVSQPSAAVRSVGFGSFVLLSLSFSACSGEPRLMDGGFCSRGFSTGSLTRLANSLQPVQASRLAVRQAGRQTGGWASSSLPHL